MNTTSDVDGGCLSGNMNDTADIRKTRDSISENETKIARASVDAHAHYYKMDHKKRGTCLILNYKKFIAANYSEREGTDKDRDDLKYAFTILGFDVEIENNLSDKETIRKVKDVAKRDHSECDCFVMCVLTHGGQNDSLMARNDSFKHEEILDPFTANNCPTLAGKPKMFFLQACRGDKMDDGIKLHALDSSRSSYEISVHADFLVAYSSIPGPYDTQACNESLREHSCSCYYSWRNLKTGSWFIQSLVEELEQSAESLDILSILTFVNRRVTVNYKSHSDAFHKEKDNKKIVSFFTSTLTRLVKFTSPRQDNGYETAL